MSFPSSLKFKLNLKCHFAAWLGWCDKFQDFRLVPEPMNHGTAIRSTRYCLEGSDSIRHRGGSLSSDKRHSGSNMAPPSRKTLSSMSLQVDGSFSWGDLSPETKLPSNQRRPLGCKHICSPMSRMMKGIAFHFTFQSKIALCHLSRQALTEISLFFIFFDELFWQMCWAPLHSQPKQTRGDIDHSSSY